MPWLYPLSVEDPGNVWEQEEDALGYDPLTAAYVPDLAPDTWTDWLVFNFPPSGGDYAQGLLSASGAGGSYELEYRDGADWLPWRSDTVANFEHPWQYFFHNEAVTAIRVRMKHDASVPLYVRAHWCRVYAECEGPLLAVCLFMYDARDFFWELSEHVSSWAIVGDALEDKFMELGHSFQGWGDNCCVASITLQYVLSQLSEGVTWAAVEALLETHAPSLYALLTRPVAYITEIVSGLIPELPDWLDDPVGYISEIVSGLIPEFPDWLSDPLAWLTDMLEENFPLLYYFVIDPAGELLYLIAQLFELTPYQAQSPEFVVKSLFERYFPDLYMLWREFMVLVGIYEREGWPGLMTELKTRFYGVAEHAIRWLWEGEW